MFQSVPILAVMHHFGGDAIEDPPPLLKSHFYKKKKKHFLHDIALRNQLNMIFTHVYFFKTCNKIKENFFFGKRVGLPLVKTYWMIVNPQNRVKKIPTICTCQTFLYYVNWLTTNFEVIFKIHFISEKISKIIMGPSTFKTHHRFSGNAYPHWGLPLSLAETLC